MVRYIFDELGNEMSKILLKNITIYPQTDDQEMK